MEKENKIGTYSFVAEPFHVDFSGKLIYVGAFPFGNRTGGNAPAI